MKPTPSPILVRHPRRLALGAALAVMALLALAAGASAAEDEAMPRKIAPPPDVALQKNLPPSTAGVEKAPPPATGAARKVAPPSNDVAPVERAGVSARSMTPLLAAGELEAPLVLQLLQSGKLTVEQAWQQNQLNVAQVSLMLEKEVRQSGSLLINDDHPGTVQLDPLRRSLAGLLVQHDARFADLVAPGSAEYSEREQAQTQRLQSIPRRVRLWVGEALLSQNDRRGEAVLQSILAEAKPPLSFDRQLEAVIAGEMISDFYHRNGDYAKSAALWLSMDEFSDDARLKSGLMVAAARDYTSMGDAKKAQQLYEQVPNDQGWLSGLILLDQARLMMSQDKQKEARRLLSQPIRGFDADQAQVFLEMLMGRSFYQSGDLQQAGDHSRAAVERYDALSKPYTQYLEPLVKSAAELAKRAEGWQREPIQVESREIVVAMQPGATQPLIRRLKVRTFRDVPLAVTSDSAAVKARVLAGEEWSETTTKTATGESEKEILLEIAPQTLHAGASSVVTVTSPALAGVETKVAVRVSAKLPGE